MPVNLRLLAAVSDGKLRVAVNEARREAGKQFGEKLVNFSTSISDLNLPGLAALNSYDQLQNAISEAQEGAGKQFGVDLIERISARSEIMSEEDVWVFLSQFKEVIKHEPSAGDVARIFSRTVLSIIGRDKQLTPVKKGVVNSLCLAVNDRPLPTMLWADFTRARLDEPETVSRILSACQKNTMRLEWRIRRIVKKSLREIDLDEDRPILVCGYSATIAAALRGLPLGVLKKLRILSPEQLLPDREIPDGRLLKQKIEADIPSTSVEVLPNEVALEQIYKRGPGLVLMGCKVIGLRRTKKLEIVNSSGAFQYAQAASKSGIPVGVVAGAYKLWPMQTYEKYRPVVVLEKANDHERNSILPGNMITWIMTDDGIFPENQFSKQYHSCFNSAGIPVAAIRYCLTKRDESFQDLAEQVSEVAKDLEKKGNEVNDLPSHFIEAQRYYEENLQKDESWVENNTGRYVAIVGKRVVLHSRDYQELSHIVREKYGYGPLFIQLVTKGPRIERIGPRLK